MSVSAGRSEGDAYLPTLEIAVVAAVIEVGEGSIATEADTRSQGAEVAFAPRGGVGRRTSRRE